MDRFGLSYRGALAPSILLHLDRLDVLELMTDDLFAADRRTLRAMRTLSSQIPVMLHGVSLGLCSAAPVDRARLEATARVVDALEPEAWSEHLAFVRAGSLEIGHLAAPPRTAATIEGSARNLVQARRVVGVAPWLENIATLIRPPGERDEARFTSALLDASDTPLLLDLHNLYANAVNAGEQPRLLLERMPIERVRAVHLAGGRPIRTANGRTVVLDDHLHRVPEEVFELLEVLARRATQPLTVVLERDGHFPVFSELLRELERARAAVAAGRRAREVA